MPVPQVIIFLNHSGQPRAELPGRNGHRESIALPVDWAERNPELMAVLQGESTRQREADDHAREHSAEMRKREMLDRDVGWWEALAPNAKEAIRHADEQAQRNQRAKVSAELARARRVWTYIATTHSITLANRAIDSKRRPRVARKIEREVGIVLQW